MLQIKNSVNILCTTFVCQLKLVLQIVKSVVDRSSTKHQHFCFDTRTYYLIHKALIAVLFFRTLFLVIFVYIATITEIVTLVNHNEVIVAPIDMLQIQSITYASVSGKIGMKKDV